MGPKKVVSQDNSVIDTTTGNRFEEVSENYWMHIRKQRTQGDEMCD